MFDAIVRLVLFLFIASLICLAMGVKHPVVAQVNQPFTLSITDKGAIPGDTTDDGPAFRAALTEVAEGSGGTILVPSGRWLISTEIDSPSLEGKSVRFLGTGSDSVIIVNTPGVRTFYIKNAENVSFEGLTFVPGTASADAEDIIRIDGAKLASVRDCNFYGVGTSGSNKVHAAIWFFSSFGILERVGFYGSASFQNSVVLFSTFRGAVVRNVTFLDHGTHDGIHHSKIPILPTASWIEVRDPISSPQNASTNGATAVIENFVGDEGALHHIIINPAAGGAGRRVQSARLSNINANVAGTIGVGVLAQDVDTLDLRHSWFGYTAVSTPGVRLQGVKKATLYGVKFGQGVDRYEIDDTNENVEIIASSPSTRLCAALTCRVADGFAGAASQGGEVTGSGIQNKLAKWGSQSNLTTSSISEEGNAVKFTGGTVTFANQGGVVFQGGTSFSGNVKLGGGPILPVVTAATDLVLGPSDAIVLASASAGMRTIYLPEPRANEGKVYTIKKIDSSENAVKVESRTFSRDTANIDDAKNRFITGQFSSITVVSSGGHWWVIESHSISSAPATPTATAKVCKKFSLCL